MNVMRWLLIPLTAIGLFGFAATPAARMGAVMVWIVGWCVTQPVPLAVTGLLGVVLASVWGGIDTSVLFSGFSHKVTLMLLGTFVVAQAMQLHGVDRALSQGLLSIGWIRKSPKRSAMALAGLAAVLSCWLSSTATITMLAPIAATMFSGQGSGRVLIAMAFAAPLGGIAFPLGANPNILAIAQMGQQLGQDVSFGFWIKNAIWVSLGSLSLLFFLLFRNLDLQTSPERHAFKGFNRQQGIVLAALALLMALWLLPLGINEAVAALAVGVALLICPTPTKFKPGGDRLLSWEHAQKMDWSV